MNKTIFKFLIIIGSSVFILAVLPILGRSFEFGNAIFWDIRFPRMLTCWLVGGGLSVGGLVFQAMFRNDLATPYVLGIASGASLGASIAVFLGVAEKIFGYWNFMVLMAFLGGLCSSFLIYLMVQYRKNFKIENLLLVGIALSMICSSLVLFTQFLGHERSILQIAHWLAGGVNVVGMETPLTLAPSILLSLFVLFFQSGKLNVLSVGKIFSLSRGVNPDKTLKFLFLVVSFLIAPIVAECGPIGFVGLIVPHIVKRWLGRDHRFLIWASFMAGGAFLGLCDLLARTLIQHTLIPVGAVTALLGGLFFLWMLLRQTRY